MNIFHILRLKDNIFERRQQQMVTKHFEDRLKDQMNKQRLKKALTHLALANRFSFTKQWPIPSRTEAGQVGLVRKAFL